MLRALPLVKGLLICTAVATVGFGYVWQKNSIYKLGDDIKFYEQQVEALGKKNDVLLDQVTRLKSPRVLEAKCKTWNLGLGVPKESQVVRVPDPVSSNEAFPVELFSGAGRRAVAANRELPPRSEVNAHY